MKQTWDSTTIDSMLARIEELEAELDNLLSEREERNWPENVMQQWDYWRKQIAEGDTSTAPRDWFETLCPPVPAVPEDYKLLPIHPNSAMLNVGADRMRELLHSASATRSNQEIVRLVYEVMQESAPKEKP